jgi:hypothetical protein
MPGTNTSATGKPVLSLFGRRFTSTMLENLLKYFSKLWTRLLKEGSKDYYSQRQKLLRRYSRNAIRDLTVEKKEDAA